MLTQYNTHNYNLKKCKCLQQKLCKVKSQTNNEKRKQALNEKQNMLYDNKIEREKHETSQLKMELNELEKYEEQYLKELKLTTVFKNQLVKQYNRRLFEDNSRKANKSCGNIPIDKYNSYSYINKKEMRTFSSTSSSKGKNIATYL